VYVDDENEDGDIETVIVDEVDYDSTFSIHEGHSIQLSDDTLDETSNDDVDNWCPGEDEYESTSEATNYGTPADDNEVCTGDTGS
jgi:hypothetical protein